MPVKRLSESQQWEVLDIIEENLKGQDFRIMSDSISDLNHFFAKIYGYGAKRDRRGSQTRSIVPRYFKTKRTKRQPSAWNKFVKTNSKKKEFQYRDGKINLKKLGVAYRRKKK